MSNGVNATEILRGIIKPQHNEDVIQTAIKMASLPSVVKAGGAGAAGATEAKCSSSGGGGGGTSSKNDKCPLLMELLYKSFQARLAKEHRLKALQIEHQHHQHHHEKSSSLKPNHSSAISALVAAAAATVPTSSVQAGAAMPAAAAAVNANQTMATSASTTNPMEATVNPFPMSSPELMAAAAAAALNQQQQQQPPPPPAPCAQPPMASYPLFSYYMNPMWASAAQYFQHPQSLMIPNVMQLGPLTSQVATAGIKRAAAPVIYPNSGTIEKRMKLA